MPPVLSVDDAPGSPPAYGGVINGNVAQPDTGVVHLSHFNNLRRRKFSHVAGLAPVRTRHVTAPAFGDAIRDIIGLSARNKMFRVHARRVVAFVQDKLFTQRAVLDLAGDAVRQQRAVIVGNDSITFGIFRAAPNPTFVNASPVNLGPEMAFDRTKRLNLAFPCKNLPALAAWFVDQFHVVDNNRARLLCQCGVGI
jgi:hypothetical protein